MLSVRHFNLQSTVVSEEALRLYYAFKEIILMNINASFLTMKTQQ